MSAPKTKPSRLGRGLSALMAQPVRITTPAPGSGQGSASGLGSSPGSGGGRARITGSDMPPATEAAGALDISAAPDHATPAGTALQLLPVGAIQPNPHQPRQRFDPASLESLAASIRREGVMQPIIVRTAHQGTNGDRAYELVAGERRWRAGQLAGLTHIPALVRDLDDRQLAEWALVENLQREDLNPIERAEAFRSLTERFELSHAEVADRIGLDRSTISNLLRLLELEPSVRELVCDGLLSMGQARALAGLTEPALQKALAQRVVAEGLSVRAVEAAVKKAQARGAAPPHADQPRPAATGLRAAHLADLEKQITDQLGSRVRIRSGRKKGTGAITIEFYSLDQFDTLLTKLGITMA